MQKREFAILALMLAALCAPEATFAQVSGSIAASSVYAEFDLSKCRLIDNREGGKSFVKHCSDEQRYEIYVARAGFHFFIGFGSGGLKQKAFDQTLHADNSVNDTIEYRVRKKGEAPYATILRYYTKSGGRGARGQVLVVTKLQGSEACHMAYIDALANSDPEALAQQAADKLTPTFDCYRDKPKVIGRKGKSPM